MVVIAVYAALVVWLTWPLADVATTRFPLTSVTSFGDTMLTTWAAAHETRTLWSGAAALADAGIYHPTSHSLYYGETGFGALPFFAPVFAATGNPTLAMNVVFLAGVVLTASAIHAVTRRWTGSHGAGFVAGVTFVTTPWVLWTWVSTAPTYAMLQYLPLVVAMTAPVAASWRRTVGLGLLVALQGLTSAYVAVATCLPIAVVAALRIVRTATRRAGMHLVAALGIGCALLLVPYWGYVQVRRENPRLEAQSIYAVQRLLPTVLPGEPFAIMQPTALPGVAWLLIIAGVVARFARRSAPPGAERRDAAWRHAALWAAVGFYFSLTPRVVIGDAQLTLPHVLLSGLYSTLRGSHRLGVTTLIAGSMLAGIAFAECARRIPGRHAAGLRHVLAGAVVVALLLAYFRPMPGLGRMLDPAAAYPTTPAPVAEGPIYDAIARSSGALLELPVCPNADSHAVAMYRAIRHRRPLLNGYDGYYPAEFPARIALACRLPDADALAELVRTTDVGMILVHAPMLGVSRRAPARPPYACPADERTPTQPGAEAQAWRDAGAPGARRDLRLVARAPDADLLFVVVRPPAR